jgi:hypothetical protein
MTPRRLSLPGAKETAMSDERPDLNRFLIERIQKSVKADHAIDVTAEEVLAVYAGDDPPQSFAEEIDQALGEYGFVGS